MIGLASPALLWGVAAAAVATVLLHLLSWRRPRPRLLPTARFLGAAAHPSRFRRVEPTDLSVLVLRLTALVATGVAVAGPLAPWRRDGVARVVVVDRSRAVASPAEARDSVLALLAGAAATRIVAFDSIATVTTVDELGGGMEGGSARGNIAAGLVAAIREAMELAADYRTVEVVVVSPAVMQGSPSLAAIAASWRGERRLVRVAARPATEPGAIVGAALPAATDPVGAAARLAWGGVPAHLRVVRDGVTPQDSAFARAGGALVVWAAGDDASGAPAAAIAAGDVAAIGPWERTRTIGAGTAIAHWHDGSPAAWESAIGTGCIREVGIGVPSRGDAILRPAFLSLVRAVTRPCSSVDLPLPGDTSLAWIGTPSATHVTAASAGMPNVWLQRALLMLALVALGAEWRVRGRSRPAVDVPVPAGAEPRVA